MKMIRCFFGLPVVTTKGDFPALGKVCAPLSAVPVIGMLLWNLCCKQGMFEIREENLLGLITEASSSSLPLLKSNSYNTALLVLMSLV